jgi:hypothetical protein
MEAPALRALRERDDAARAVALDLDALTRRELPSDETHPGAVPSIEHVALHGVVDVVPMVDDEPFAFAAQFHRGRGIDERANPVEVQVDVVELDAVAVVAFRVL